jgi:hypothetical protein
VAHVAGTEAAEAATMKSPRAGTPTHAARDRGDTMTALRPIGPPLGPVYVMMLSGIGVSS